MSYVPPRHIRPIAICVLKRGDSVFVFEGYDSVKNQTFYRPLGGAIEFDELGSDAVTREIREEIGADLVNSRLPMLQKSLTACDDLDCSEL